MTIVENTPPRIELHEHVIHFRFVEDAPAQFTLAWLLGSELRNDDQMRRSACARELLTRMKNLARDGDSSFDRLIRAKAQQAMPDRDEAPAPLRGTPLET